MPKNSDEKIALIALIALAAWLFVGLPLLYLPPQDHVHGEFSASKSVSGCWFSRRLRWRCWSTWMLVKGAEKTAERQLRAYVLVDKATVFSATRELVVALYPADTGKGGQRMEVQAGYQPMAHFYFKNFGQTPAHDVEMFGNAAIVPWPLMPETFPDIDWGREQSRQSLDQVGSVKRLRFLPSHIWLAPKNTTDCKPARSP